MLNKEDGCIRYLMKEMDPSEEVEFEREMMKDENLLIEVESLRKTYQKLGKLSSYEAPASLQQKVVRDAVALQQKNIAHTQWWTGNLAKYAAVAVILLAVFSAGWMMSGSQFESASGELQNQAVQASSAQSVVSPWVDNKETIRFAGTSIQSNGNVIDLSSEVERSYNKLKLVNSETGLPPSSANILLTSTIE